MYGITWEVILRALIAVLTALLGLVAGQSERVQDIMHQHKRYVVDVPEGMAGVNMLTAQGGRIVKAMATRKAYVTKMSVNEVETLKAMGYAVYEDRIYTISQQGCTPQPGGPGDPQPPNPPEPPTGDKIDWGVSRLKGLEAQGLVNGRVKVAVLDTGIDRDHEDLKGVFSYCKSFVGTGSCEDDQGHGTHVAGIIAASRNGVGTIGVAAGKVDLMIGKVLDAQGSGYGSDIADGIRDAANNGARIISMSLGSPRQWGPDPLIRQATDYAIGKGVIVIAANGNDSSSSGPGYPADNPGVMAIASSDAGDRLSHFSTHGPGTDYIAPGSNILSSRMGGGTVVYSGTSMATPYVAGVWALCLASGKDCNSLKGEDLGLGANKQGKGLPGALQNVQ